MSPAASQSSLIAVVDDDISVRESVESLLKSVGFRVNTYCSAEEFMSSPRLDSAECLILDVRLDGMSGPDLQREIDSSDRDGQNRGAGRSRSLLHRLPSF